MIKLSSKNYFYEILFVFLAVFIPKLIFCLIANPLSVPSDEIATMSAGAYVAGLDWSAVISKAGYYGGGMTVFTAPIYWLTDNPVTIYRAVGIFCAFLQSLPAVIAYYVTKKYYKVKDITAMLIGIACGFLVMSQAQVVYNESALILVSWMLMLLIYKLHESVDIRKLRQIFTVLLMLVLAYAMTLHTRAVTYWIVLVILLLCYRWGYGKWLCSIPTMMITGVFGWIGAQGVIHYLQNVLWSIGSGEAVRNGSISVGGGFQALLGLKDIRAWLSIVLGQIHTVGVFTGGFAILFVCVFIVAICQFVFSKKLRMRAKSDVVMNMSIPVIVFFLAAVMITIAGQSVSWLGGSIAVYENGYQSQQYGVKAFAYLRYFGIYCGPLLMIGMVWLAKKKEWMMQFFKWALLIMILIEVYWIFCIVPYIHLCSEWGVFEYYYPFTWYSPVNPARYVAFMPASIVMFAVFILGKILIQKDKKEICFIILCILFINSYFYRSVKWDTLNADICATWVDDGYRTIKAVEEVTELPETIYVEDLWDKKDHNNYYMYQFFLNRYCIIPERPESNLEEAILFSNADVAGGYYEELLKKGYKYSVIGDYEIVLVKGERLQEAFIQAGIQLLDK